MSTRNQTRLAARRTFEAAASAYRRGERAQAAALIGAIDTRLLRPDQLERLRADRTLLPSAVEEILRYATPILHFRRTVTRDTEVGGRAVQEGDKVVFWYG